MIDDAPSMMGCPKLPCKCDAMSPGWLVAPKHDRDACGLGIWHFCDGWLEGRVVPEFTL
jgi:hypothetical protein